tara:strand:- start:38 stop:199 length:162 start_codon:yes stop_codon:yes gene_type:complete
MSKRLKPGADQRAPNPSKRKLLGRSFGPLVFNEHVNRMVTPKIDKAINNNREK